MDPVKLIIASLDVKGAFPNTPWLLLEAVWKRTGADLTPLPETGSRGSQGGAVRLFLYLLVRLPLPLLCGDLDHHPKGTINSIHLVGASFTVIYDTLSQMRVLHRSGAHNTPFLQLPTWPQHQLYD